MATVRDKLWMFGVRPHQDDVNMRGRQGQRLRRKSRITPAEGALMLDIPNMIMVTCEGEPIPFSEDAYGYAESFITMDKVLWSGISMPVMQHGGVEEAFICDLAEKYPNICGAFLDDFLVNFRGEEGVNEKAAAFLRDMRERLGKACRPMDLWMVWYTYETGYTAPEVLDQVDGFVLWTWDNNELPLLEARFEQLEKTYPDKRKMLGIYMYDFPNYRMVPLDLMEHQCNVALKLLKEKRIEGIVIECNATMGMGMESELWLRDWIKKVKDIELD